MENTLSIQIGKPVQELFDFCVTPPNSSRWIPGVVTEETNEWPVRVGTIYRLRNERGDWFEVAVSAIEKNRLVEFLKDDGYHCRYTFAGLNEEESELTYYEWMDSGEFEPFTADALVKLKQVIEA